MVSRLLALESRGLVGAAGFEPATWSTQNSRATRLRYAPGLSRRGLDTRFAVCQQAAPHPRQTDAVPNPYHRTKLNGMSDASAADLKFLHRVPRCITNFENRAL